MHKSLYEYMLSFLLGKYIEVEWLDHMEGVFWFFKLSTFSKMAILFALFPAACERSSCSLSLPILGIVDLLDFSHCQRYVVVYHCDINLYFPNDIKHHCHLYTLC